MTIKVWVVWQILYVSKTRPSVRSFTKYLWFLFRERNLPLAALKVHRSAIATIVGLLSRTLLSQHHIRRFLEALFLSRPPRRIVKFIWSVAAVLDMLREWGLVRDVGRPKFSLRAMLIAWWAIVLYAYWWKSYVSVKIFLALHSCFQNETGSTWTYFTCCGDIQTMFTWIMFNY